MEVGHVSVEEGVDRVLRPLPYFDSEMVAALRLEKAIDIQRYTRGWFARSAAIALLTTQAAEEVAMAEVVAAEVEKEGTTVEAVGKAGRLAQAMSYAQP